MAVASSANRWCAFADTSCLGGQKWGVLVGDGLASTCVAPGSPPDGAVRADGPVDLHDAGTADASGNPDAASSAADAGPGVIGVDKDTYSFGAVLPSQSVSHTFLVTNHGASTTGPMSAIMGGVDASSFALDASGCQDKALDIGGSCGLKVTFSTTTEPMKQGVLTVTATPGGMATVMLDGSGVAPAALSAQPTALDFQTLLNSGTAGSLSLTIHNGRRSETDVKLLRNSATGSFAGDRVFCAAA